MSLMVMMSGGPSEVSGRDSVWGSPVQWTVPLPPLPHAASVSPVEKQVVLIRNNELTAEVVDMPVLPSSLPASFSFFLPFFCPSFSLPFF